MLIKNDPFGRGKWKDFINQLWFMEYHKLTIEDIKRALLISPITAKKCTNCKAVMNITSVNTGLGDQTGDDSKSVWICSNMQCLETEYSDLSVSEEIKKLEEEYERI